MRGLALAVVGLWVILQTTYGPLAEKLGLIAWTAPKVNAPSGAGATPNPNYKTQASCQAAGGTWYPPGDPNGKCYPSE